MDKLNYGEWNKWTENEQEAILTFLYAWWTEIIHSLSYDHEIFMMLTKLTNDLDKLLLKWVINFEDNSFANFVEFVYYYYPDLVGGRKHFKELDALSINMLIQWTKDNAGKLEDGFFHFENSNQEFAEKISTALFIFEQSIP